MIHACVLASRTRLLTSNEVHLFTSFLLMKFILLVTVAENSHQNGGSAIDRLGVYF